MENIINTYGIFRSKIIITNMKPNVLNELGLLYQKSLINYSIIINNKIAYIEIKFLY